MRPRKQFQFDDGRLQNFKVVAGDYYTSHNEPSADDRQKKLECKKCRALKWLSKSLIYFFFLNWRDNCTCPSFCCFVSHPLNGHDFSISWLLALKTRPINHVPVLSCYLTKKKKKDKQNSFKVELELQTRHQEQAKKKITNHFLQATNWFNDDSRNQFQIHCFWIN